MNIEEYLAQTSVRIAPDRRQAVLALLRDQVCRERSGQGCGDTEFMKLLVLQLFGLGLAGDALPIWAAKNASMDSGCSIDVQLLCGAGLEETRSFLKRSSDPAAASALEYIDSCIECGDFKGFSPEGWFAQLREYFAPKD